ncbi:MAG: NifB/NifX family molybdenum-iron cluster-binding protein [Desulfurobacteriaceae bacterium]
MIVALPIDERGNVVSMFGSAPSFLVINTESGEKKVVSNLNSCGGCSVGCSGGKSPADLLAENGVEALLIEQIPEAPLKKLLTKGIVVYQLPPTTNDVNFALKLLEEKKLKVFYLNSKG